MNIRVDMNTPIKDGAELKFRSPVDCSQVTGLIVHYPENGSTVSKEFAFADAHGNNVGDIDHLFAENVVVKVILDLETNMAFVQNADTNAYLEGRFKELEDKISNPLVVTITGFIGEKLTSSHKAGEIYRHFEKYGNVIAYLKNHVEYISLNFSDLYNAHFYSHDTINGSVVGIDIDENGNVSFSTIKHALKTDVDKMASDIETALDAIIEIQNELIGGDG